MMTTEPSMLAAATCSPLCDIAREVMGVDDSSTFFFNDPATTEIYTLSLHDALPIFKDECSRLLEASTMKSRRGFAIQRWMNAMRQAHADGWFIVFDSLTLADDRLEAFYDNPNALRDYFRDI